ncbi:kinesin family member 22 [Diaporthe helianthi]|uniref:Kinesin-like protein n=1 Tax=Diaporthe helianthi TaxID=158607 RepID=A0A2P5I583_DIAHE|nr:kinesin family member 22 [Diaporthe helianthi]
MSVRVIARIRPLLEGEAEKDVIVRADSKDGGTKPTVVRIPNPKNESEDFNFSFGGVYDQSATQEALFTAEGRSAHVSERIAVAATDRPSIITVSPHMKALFQGLDVTIFAYGVTGTGKTHTMRGGLKLADRGLIPRLLSNIFRRGKKTAKDSDGTTTVEVGLSYYEIYNDKVFDLLQPPDRRTPSGLPLREANGKTIVVGLSEQPCEDHKDFEKLYIEANTNRITAATKLNAHSSRSHAILRVKVTQTTGEQVLESTVSMIDLAGSEDNRRTENNRERLVESAAINKSLFVLSQCVDAISRGDKRIPYRESKMTRILSLGQNNGITVMILNLAPIRSYHLDTLSSLNVSSRAKRIEVREIENEIVFKQAPRSMALSGTGIQRQPLKPLTNTHNIHAGTVAKEKADKEKGKDKPTKLFSVFVDTKSTTVRPAVGGLSAAPRNALSSKRKSDTVDGRNRPSKMIRPGATTRPQATSAAQSMTMSAAQIEEMVERKVQEILASRIAAQPREQEENAPPPVQPPSADISEAVQRRLDALERRIEDAHGEAGGGKSEGMRLLLQARKLKEQGDDEGTLTCYESALRYFPKQPKLLGKIDKLKAKIAAKSTNVEGGEQTQEEEKPRSRKGTTKHQPDDENEARDSPYVDGDADADADESYVDSAQTRPQPNPRSKAPSHEGTNNNLLASLPADDPRTHQLLEIVNSRDVSLIKGLRGFGAKKAQSLVTRMNSIDYGGTRPDQFRVDSLAQLSGVFGMGEKVVEKAWEGLAAVREGVC